MTMESEMRQACHVMLKKYPDVMSVTQLAEVLSVSTKTCYKLVADGKIEVIQVGRAYRIPKTKVFKYLLAVRSQNR
ncbi:MAG: excisionase family DNA-binding protein [Oscillospiraceae bacterium]